MPELPHQLSLMSLACGWGPGVHCSNKGYTESGPLQGPYLLERRLEIFSVQLPGFLVAAICIPSPCLGTDLNKKKLTSISIKLAFSSLLFFFIKSKNQKELPVSTAEHHLTENNYTICTKWKNKSQALPCHAKDSSPLLQLFPVPLAYNSLLDVENKTGATTNSSQGYILLQSSRTLSERPCLFQLRNGISLRQLESFGVSPHSPLSPPQQHPSWCSLN